MGSLFTRFLSSQGEDEISEAEADRIVAKAMRRKQSHVNRRG